MTRDEQVLQNVNIDTVSSKNWYESDISAANWSGSFPYQLILVMEKDGKYVEAVSKTNRRRMDALLALKGTSPSKTPSISRFTLPIPPTNLSISMPFASALSFTLGGVAEEHSGTPVRHISFSGTTGVLPFRQSALKPAGTLEKLGNTVLGGTIQAASTAISRVKEIALGSGESHIYKGLGEETTDTEISKYTTGYYQFHLLRRFLESYAHEKTLEENQNLRLALAVWKDSAVYLVTPVQFTLTRTAGSPLEYHYTLQFRAWKRISLAAQAPEAYANTPEYERRSYLEHAHRALDTIRAGIGVAGAVATGVKSDVASTVGLLREATLIYKQALGLPLTIRDIGREIDSSVRQILELAKQDIDDAHRLWDDAWRSGSDEGTQPLASRASAIEGSLSPDTPISARRVPQAIRTAARDHIERIENFTASDYRNLRDEAQKQADLLAISEKVLPSAYAATYGLGEVEEGGTLDPEDAETLYAFQALVQAFDSLAASAAYEQSENIIPSAVEYVAALANEAAIPFSTILSAFAVPMPVGVSLDRISAMYLGDPNRWHEIATLNGLRAPFIDEEGFTLPLLENAKRNTVIVSADERLRVGQSIEIVAETILPTRAHILSIEEVAGTYTLTLSADNLDRYLLIHKPAVHAHLPGTINSSQLLLIPSESPPEQNISVPDGVDRFDELLEVGGVDLLLTEAGDIYFGPDGRTRYAYGLTNIIQSLRLLLTTPRGSLIHHPTYGISVAVGDMVSDVTASDILREIEESLSLDPAFERVVAVEVEKRGPAVILSLVVSVRGLSDPIPVSFTLR